VQATGVGAPGAAMVLADLAELGTRAAVRVGPCVALAESLRIGDLLLVERAFAADGTSAALGADGWVEPDAGLTAALADAAGPEARPSSVASADLVWDPASRDGFAGVLRADEWRAEGADAVEMQAAALLALGSRLGVPVACLLVVSDREAGPAVDADEAVFAEATARAGRIAAEALAAVGSPQASGSGTATLS
jgi:uridine phosphorylase